MISSPPRTLAGGSCESFQSTNIGRSGKVRELFKINESTLLMAVTDRISAYDAVLSTGVPDKGAILCQMSGQYITIRNAAIIRELEDETTPDTTSSLEVFLLACRTASFTRY